MNWLLWILRKLCGRRISTQISKILWDPRKRKTKSCCIIHSFRESRNPIFSLRKQGPGMSIQFGSSPAVAISCGGLAPSESLALLHLQYLQALNHWLSHSVCSQSQAPPRLCRLTKKYAKLWAQWYTYPRCSLILVSPVTWVFKGMYSGSHLHIMVTWDIVYPSMSSFCLFYLCILPCFPL